MYSYGNNNNNNIYIAPFFEITQSAEYGRRCGVISKKSTI